jgi:hypothetical protein
MSGAVAVLAMAISCLGYGWPSIWTLSRKMPARRVGGRS